MCGVNTPTSSNLNMVKVLGYTQLEHMCWQYGGAGRCICCSKMLLLPAVHADTTTGPWLAAITSGSEP